MTSALTLLAPVVAFTTVLNVSLGRLRVGAARTSRRRFGLLAASALLVIALRHVFEFAWAEAAVLILAMLVGQYLGRYLEDAAEPSSLRWRTAVYAVIAASLWLLAGQPAHAQNGNEWNRLDANEPAPTFTLTNQDGKRVALKDFRGKAVVLTFVYTECKDICPVLPQIIGRTDQHLKPGERERTRFIGISLDPRRDTPEKLRGFMEKHNLPPERWTLLTGSLKEATRAADDYGIVVKPDVQGDLVHNAVYILIDPQGRLRYEFHGLFTPTPEIAKALRGLIETKKPAKKKG